MFARHDDDQIVLVTGPLVAWAALEPAYGHAAIDGDGPDEDAGVIGVLPDEVDAIGCQNRPGFGDNACPCETYRNLLYTNVALLI